MTALIAQLESIESYKILVLCTGLLLQGAVFTLFPEEVIILALGYFWGQNRFRFLDAFVSIELGLLPANAALVFLSSQVGSRLLEKRPFCWIFKREVIERASLKLRKTGYFLIFITRFIPTIRGAIYVAVGLTRKPLFDFIKIDAIASCFQVPLLLLVGRTVYFIKADRSKSFEYASILGIYGLIAAVLIAGFFYCAPKKSLT